MTERGAVTLWVLGLCVMVLFVGGISLDLWRGLVERRELTTLADAAAVAGGSGIDEETWRRSGELVLDPPRAVSLAEAVLATVEEPLEARSVSVAPDGSLLTVTVADHVEFSLLRVFAPGGLAVEATATAQPRSGG